MKSFSIIIVTWNGLHLLKQFLPSVAATNYPDYEIIIADNASEDGTREWLSKEYPDVRIAELDRNYGYCGGNNRAVEYAKNDILLFLNNDVEVSPDWLNAINQAFKNPQTGAVQPKIRSFEQKDYFEYAGAAGGLIDKYGYTFCRGRIFDHVEPDLGQFDENCDIFWASGAALAIRKELFEEIGGFDEDFEFHMEEIDVCWRVQHLGKRIKYVPDSVVYHLGGGSLPMGSPRKVFYNFRNNLFMLWKNYSTKELFTRFLPRMVLDGIAAIKALLSGKWAEFSAIFRAHVHFYMHLPVMSRKRSHIQKLKKTDATYRGVYPGSVVYAYFLKGKMSVKQLKTWNK